LKLRRIVETPYALTVGSLPQTTGVFGYNYYSNEAWRRAVGDAYPVSYGLGNDATGRLIMSDFYGSYGLTAIYTQAVSDPTQFAPDFAEALAWRIAAHLASSLAYDPKKQEVASRNAEKFESRARATAMNELQSDIPHLRRQSETVRARWGG
jgi:hypothetical protein